MRELLIATANPGKFREYYEGLSSLSLTLRSLKDFNLASIEETGKTFEENAELKARSYFEKTGIPCIADDGGLEIDALGGAPGVISRRWKTGDENVTDQELVDYTLLRMKEVPAGERTARLTLVAAFYDGKKMETARTVTEGEIATAPTKYEPGFPYRALLYIPRFSKMYDELSHEEHEAVNHRRAALALLLPAIQSSFAIDVQKYS